MTHHAHSFAGLGLPSFDPLAPYGWSPTRSEEFHAIAPPGCEPGRIVASTRGLALAQTARGECWGVPTGRLRELLQRDGLGLCAGDWVLLQPKPGPSKASVSHMLPRSAALMRQGAGPGSRPQCLAANHDVVLLVMGLDRNFNPARLERLLALAWSSGAQPVVVLTKRDLFSTMAMLKGPDPLRGVPGGSAGPGAWPPAGRPDRRRPGRKGGCRPGNGSASSAGHQIQVC